MARRSVLYLHVPSPPPPNNGVTAPSGPGPPHYRGFTITLRHTTLGRACAVRVDNQDSRSLKSDGNADLPEWEAEDVLSSIPRRLNLLKTNHICFI
jgi:hypothetical protein